MRWKIDVIRLEADLFDIYNNDPSSAFARDDTNDITTSQQREPFLPISFAKKLQ